MLLTIADVKVKLEEIVSASPTKRNPTDDDRSWSCCVYDDGNGCHCVIGQLLIELGAPLPYDNTKSLSRMRHLYAEYFTPGALDFMSELQEMFDYGITDRPEWRDALRDVKIMRFWENTVESDW